MRRFVLRNRRGKNSHPDPAREIKLEELKQLRADVARLHHGLVRIEEKINEMVEEGER